MKKRPCYHDRLKCGFEMVNCYPDESRATVVVGYTENGRMEEQDLDNLKTPQFAEDHFVVDMECKDDIMELVDKREEELCQQQPLDKQK